LPESDLGAVVLDVAAPLLERLGPAPRAEDVRGAIELAVAFWNASVLASKRWEYPRLKALNELRKRMRGRQAAPGDAATFDLLAERWRAHWLDPRLVGIWTYDAHDGNARRLVCAVAVPDGVRVEVPPPLEKRVAIGGKFLDEVGISLGGNASLRFPVERHSGVLDEHGTATVHAMMPAALQLFAEGLLPRVGGDPVEIMVAGQKLASMVLVEVRCGGGYGQHDIAILVFKPATGTCRSTNQ